MVARWGRWRHCSFLRQTSRTRMTEIRSKHLLQHDNRATPTFLPGSSKAILLHSGPSHASCVVYYMASLVWSIACALGPGPIWYSSPASEVAQALLCILIRQKSSPVGLGVVVTGAASCCSGKMSYLMSLRLQSVVTQSR